VITVPNRYGQTDRQTDRQTISNLNTALCTKVHRAVKNQLNVKDPDIYMQPLAGKPEQ